MKGTGTRTYSIASTHSPFKLNGWMTGDEVEGGAVSQVLLTTSSRGRNNDQER